MLRAHGPRHGRDHRAHPFWRAVGVLSVALLTFGFSAVSAFQYLTSSKIDPVRFKGLAGDPPPVDPAAGDSLNILLIGSDDRSGENETIGGADPGMRSDTTIVMHVSSDRNRIEMVSIPRDSLVKVPECRTTNGKTIPAVREAMFNSAFAKGWDTGGDMDSAAACAVATVQANTNLRIDHVVIVDFAGFQKMVDAVGGVDLCLEKAMKDARYTGLDLPAGMQRLDGVQALQYARARHVTGTDGSDTSRIGRQQQLLGALAAEVLSKNVFTDTLALTRFVGAVTDSLHMDPDLKDTRNAVGIAYSMRGIDTSKIVFTTVPSGPDSRNPNRIRWSSQADDVWAALATDRPILDVLDPPAPEPSGSPTVDSPPTAEPDPPTGVTTVDHVQQSANQVCGA